MTSGRPGPASVTPLRKKRTCPSCGAASNRDTWPFCSKRCSDADLGRWFSGRYAVPSAEPVDEEAIASALQERREGGED